jgi:hypothetical protein
MTMKSLWSIIKNAARRIKHKGGLDLLTRQRSKAQAIEVWTRFNGNITNRSKRKRK